MPKMTGESVLRGLRLEPDLAKALRRYAETQAQAHGESSVNMAAAARTLLRSALNVAKGEHACKREAYFTGLREARQKIAGALK
jgi:hypothetical protein